MPVADLGGSILTGIDVRPTGTLDCLPLSLILTATQGGGATAVANLGGSSLPGCDGSPHALIPKQRLLSLVYRVETWRRWRTWAAAS